MYRNSVNPIIMGADRSSGIDPEAETKWQELNRTRYESKGSSESSEDFGGGGVLVASRLLPSEATEKQQARRPVKKEFPDKPSRLNLPGTETVQFKESGSSFDTASVKSTARSRFGERWDGFAGMNCRVLTNR